MLPPPAELPPDLPLAAPRTRPLSSAEPAKVIGWLLLGSFGVWNLYLYAGSGHALNLVFGLACTGLTAGFMQAHRHPTTWLARAWIGLFTALMALAAVTAKLADLFI